MATIKFLFGVGNTSTEPNKAYINETGMYRGYSENGDTIFYNGNRNFNSFEFEDEISFRNPSQSYGLVKDGYKFKNWLMIYVDENGIPSDKGEYFEPFTTYSASLFKDFKTESDAREKDITCYLAAQWEPIVTKVTLLSLGMNPSTQYIYVKFGVGWYSDSAATNEITKISIIPQSSNEIFVGYYDENDDSIIYQSGQIKDDSTRLFLDSQVTLTAKTWERKDPEKNYDDVYTYIHYNKNYESTTYKASHTAFAGLETIYDTFDATELADFGGFCYIYGEQDTISLYTMQPCEITAKANSKRIYSFVGWGLSPDQHYVSYNNSESITCLPEDIYLYALWRRDLKITFYLNNGTDASFSKIFSDYHTQNNSEINCNLSGLSPYRRGYNFLGWSISEDATSVDYQPNTSILINSDISLYAIWEKQKVDIIYNYDTNKSKSLTQSFEFNDALEDSQWFGRSSDGSLLWIPEEGVDTYTSKYGFGPWSWIGKKIIGWIDENNIEYKNSLTNPNSDYEDKYVTVTNTWIIAHDNETINLYPILDPNGAANIYIDSQWKVGLPYIFIDGEWKQALPYIYNGSEWKIGV